MTSTIDRPSTDTLEQPDPAPTRRVRRYAIRGAGLLATLLVLLGVVVAYSSRQTESDIRALHEQVELIGTGAPSPVLDPAAVAELPLPVQRYFEFVFVDAPRPLG